jgi:hypothetical protein
VLRRSLGSLLLSTTRAQSPLCRRANRATIILLEADGLCLNSKLVVLNEAKATPSSFDVNGLTKRGLLLKLILASPDGYETKPPEVKQQLEKFRDVRLVLSGYHFKEQVEIVCAKPDPPIWMQVYEHVICT